MPTTKAGLASLLTAAVIWARRAGLRSRARTEEVAAQTKVGGAAKGPTEEALAQAGLTRRRVLAEGCLLPMHPRIPECPLRPRPRPLAAAQGIEAAEFEAEGRVRIIRVLWFTPTPTWGSSSTWVEQQPFRRTGGALRGRAEA